MARRACFVLIGGREQGLALKQIEWPGLKAGMDFRSKVKTGVKIDMFGLK